MDKEIATTILHTSYTGNGQWLGAENGKYERSHE